MSFMPGFMCFFPTAESNGVSVQISSGVVRSISKGGFQKVPGGSGAVGDITWAYIYLFPGLSP